MREYTPNVIDDASLQTTITIDHLPAFDIADYDLSNPKEQTKYFKNIERICRTSRSYKKFIEYLRACVDMNKCSFFENVNNLDTFSIKIHIHHAPLTLYDIVETVYAKHVACNESITENAIAKEVMYNHYATFVGLIPLSETVHELVHSGYLFIPTDKVYGFYKSFIDRYKPYMDNQLLYTLNNAEEYTKSYNYARETKILTMNTVYIDTSGIYEFPKMEDVIESLKDKIEAIDEKCTRSQYYDTPNR